jgi:hypothetical protein
MSALNEIHSKLLETGLNEFEADGLLARFLEEEAYDYVECMSIIRMRLEDKAGSEEIIS